MSIRISRRALLIGLGAYAFTVKSGLATHGAFAEGSVSYTLGNTIVTLREFRSGRGGHSYFAPHSNETVAVVAAEAIVRQYGGHLIALSHGDGQRNITFNMDGKKYVVDPNRIFSDAGARDSLHEQGGNFSPEALRAVRGLAAAILKQIFADGIEIVVGVHNNTNGAPLSIESYTKEPSSVGCPECGNQAAAAQTVFVNPALDHDDFFFVTRADFFALLEKKDFNVAFQAWPLEDDGSLSVYCQRNGVPYINIEAQLNPGHLLEQEAMLKAIQNI